jgi:hypothetical protein
MSQYFTYEDLQGRVHTDVLTADPSCKTCSTSKCYNTYDNVQGVSLSKHIPYSSIKLGENDRTPVRPFDCDTSMLTCNNATLVNSDPYNIVIKSTTKCDPLNYSNYDIAVPRMTGSLDRNKVESPRYVKHKSHRNSSNLASDIIEPKSIRDLSREKAGLDVYNILPFDYKTEVVVVPVKTSLSARPRPMSSNVTSNKDGRESSKQLSKQLSLSSVRSKPSLSPVSPKLPVKVSASILTKPLNTKSSSVSSEASSRSVQSKPLVGSNTKSNRVPLALPVSPRRK